MKSWPFFFVGVICSLITTVVFHGSAIQGILVGAAVALIILLANEAAR